VATVRGWPLLLGLLTLALGLPFASSRIFIFVVIATLPLSSFQRLLVERYM